MAVINGTVDPDLLEGTAETDSISGGDGDDTITGGGGTDTLGGGAGDDSITGDSGNDSVTGGAGNDSISAGSGDDLVQGGAGNDTMAAGLGVDVVQGGGGQSDLLVVDYSAGTTAVAMAAPTLTGPVIEGYPAPGGTTFSSTGLPGDTGGRTGTYTGFDTTQYDSLWWGPASIGAAMDGAISGGGEALTFVSAEGGVLTYVGTTTVSTSTGTLDIFTKYVATIVGGAGDWVTAASVGITGGPEYVALINDATFEVKQEFLASTSIDGTYQSINALYNSLATSGSQVRTSVNGQFAYDDGGFSGSISDGEGNSTSFSGIERFDIRSGSGADLLYGGAGGDSIDGGAGADTMQGGAGDDTYAVDDAGDTVTEFTDEGSDRVVASVSYTLGDVVEHLTLAGVDHVDGTGNVLDNEITGNDGANVLTGGVGNDTLNGMGGADTLLDGVGDDLVNGGGGDDSISSGLGTDTVAGGAGDDLLVLEYSLAATAVSLAAPILTVDGADGTITDGINTTGFSEIERFDIRTGIGADDVTTGDGNDVVQSGEGDDTVSGGRGDDTLSGDLGADLLHGDAGADLIDGGADADTMHGGLGDDVYWVVDVGDTVVEADDEGIDTVLAAVSHTLAAGVENMEMTDAAVNGTGNALANQITGTDTANVLAGMDGDDVLRGLSGNDSLLGGSGNDTLDGGGGNDLLTGGAGLDAMQGGLGNDIYSVTEAGDVATEIALEGTDRVDTDLATYTLSANLENLVGTSTLGQRLTGNGLANVITGAGGADILNGGAGADVLNGNGGNDKLTGGTGLDTLRGGAGNDIYSVTEVGETVAELAGQGTDRVDTNLAAYSLGANVENLVGTRALGQTLTGNGLANVITGAGGADVLNGGLGTDTLNGGGGNDLLAGGAGRDVLAGGLGADRFDYNLVSESGPLAAQQDLIQAFQRGSDRIDLATIDANAGLAGNQVFAFIGNAAFSAAGQVRVVQVSGATLLEVNTVGTGGAEMVIRLAGTVPLTASDLVL